FDSLAAFSLIFSFFFSCYVLHQILHSFPTRRSSDLNDGIVTTKWCAVPLTFPRGLPLVFEVVARYFLGKKTGVSSGGTTFKSYSTLKSPSPHLCGDTIARFAVLSTYGLSTLKVIRTS